LKILALFRRIPGIDPKNLGYYIAEIYIMLYSCRKIGEFWENILKNVEKSRLVLSFKLNIINLNSLYQINSTTLFT
jgi:hypothetical protein